MHIYITSVPMLANMEFRKGDTGKDKCRKTEVVSDSATNMMKKKLEVRQ